MATAKKARNMPGPKLDLRRQLRGMGLSNIGAHKILFFQPARAVPVIAVIAKKSFESAGSPEIASVLLSALITEPVELKNRLFELLSLEVEGFGTELLRRMVEHAIIVLPYIKSDTLPLQ